MDILKNELLGRSLFPFHLIRVKGKEFIKNPDNWDKQIFRLK